MNSERFTGKVLWFSERRGYGFCSPDDFKCNGGNDLFLHYSNLQGEPGKFKTVSAGAIISFVVGANNNGPQAEDIVIVEEPKLED